MLSMDEMVKLTNCNVECMSFPPSFKMCPSDNDSLETLPGNVVLTDQVIYYELYTLKFITIYGINKVK